MDRMWKRIPRPGKGKENQVIGNPVLVESTLDKDRLNRMPTINNGQSGYQPVQPISRSNTADRDNIVSIAPSVSSIYSTQYGAVQGAPRDPRDPVASSYYGDVSPPDSPEIFGIRKSDDGDVSPIGTPTENDIHPAFRIHQKPANTSNIPVAARRNISNNQDSPNRAYNRDPSKPIKWNKYTGEPTTSEKGLPSRVMPGNVVAGLEKTRLKRVADRPNPARPADELTIDTRPPWKGASGRSATVPPVRDQPAQRNPAEHRRLPATNLPSPPPSSSPIPIVARKMVPTEPETAGASPVQAGHASKETIKPMTASDSKRNQQQSIPASNKTAAMTGAYPSPPLGTDESHADQDVTPRESSDSHRTRSKQTDSTAVNIGSRFSWTTQATNTTYQHSPPPSPPPPLPIPMHTVAQTNPAAPVPVPTNSIMNRKRPVPSARNYSPEPASPIIVNEHATRRKAVGLGVRNDSSPSSPHPPSSFSPPPNSQHPPRSSSRAPSIASTVATVKALPPTPMQLASADHAGALQAQLDDLALQRNNVSRVLRDLTSADAINPLKTNFLVEREREKRVTALRDELNEITMAEHDIGLRLHRANKRREREEGNEGFTTLWVRRVTS